MFRNLNLFLKKNKKIITNNKNKKIVLIADRQRFDQSIRSSLIAKIFNNKGYNPVVISNKLNSDFIEIYKSFGISNFLNTSILSNKIFFLKNFFLYTFLSIFNLIKFYFLGLEKFKFNFKINDVLIGSQICDQYFKNKDKFKKGILTLDFLRILLLAYIKINIIQNFIKKNNVKHSVVSTDCYLNESSILFHLSKKHRIKCIVTLRQMIKLYSKKKDFEKHIYEIKLEDIPKNIKISNFNKHAESRFEGKIDHPDVIKAFRQKKNIYNQKSFESFFNINPKKYKKIILFAPHVFSDCCHTDGPFPFLNYYNFFTETIDEINKIKDIFWIIKPHPARHLWNEDNLVKDYLQNKLQKNMYICPDYINTKSLLQYVDTIVTGRGTIAIECAVFGKRPLTCGGSYYSEFGFFKATKNKKEFFNSLKFKNYKFILSNNLKVKAKKSLYFYGHLIWEQDSKILPVMFTKDFKSLNKYFNHINKQLKKFSFLKDNFYLTTKKKIEKKI